MFDKIKDMANKVSTGIKQELSPIDADLGMGSSCAESEIKTTANQSEESSSVVGGFFDSAVSSASKTFKSATDSIKDFSIMDKVKTFSEKSVEVVASIDQHLTDTQSPYEVSNFRVSSRMGFQTGLSLDIQFAKSQTARALKFEKEKYLEIISPITKKPFKILRNSVFGKKTARVKDPSNGEILLIDASTGKILEAENSTLQK
jgi:hypothetical protein